jgi:hypothetical protein
MSTITVNFKNLCALFTNKLNDELMVGLLDLTDFYGVRNADIHYPKITIETEKKTVNPNGETISIPQNWTYEGFLRTRVNHPHEEDAHAMRQQCECMGSIFGNIVLEVPRLQPGLKRKLSKDKKMELKERENARRPTNKPVKIDSFDKSLDIEKQLYGKHPLKVNPDLCKAKFFFRHGVLYSIFAEPSTPVVFEPHGSNADGIYPIETGLEIEVPNNGYAVLRFLNVDTPDFVFQGGEEYYITIENSPSDHLNGDVGANDTNHFQFYYKLVENDKPLDPIYLPSEPKEPSDGGPFCMNGDFGLADYRDLQLPQ